VWHLHCGVDPSGTVPHHLGPVGKLAQDRLGEHPGLRLSGDHHEHRPLQCIAGTASDGRIDRMAASRFGLALELPNE